MKQKSQYNPYSEHPPGSASQEQAKLSWNWVVHDDVVVAVDADSAGLLLKDFRRRNVAIVRRSVGHTFENVKESRPRNVSPEKKRNVTVEYFFLQCGLFPKKGFVGCLKISKKKRRNRRHLVNWSMAGHTAWTTLTAPLLWLKTLRLHI